MLSRWKNRALIYSPLVLVPLIDLFIKYLVFSEKANFQLGPIIVKVAINRGILGGFLADKVTLIHQVPLVAAGLFLLTGLYFLQFLAPIKSMLFRLSISLFFAGILANILDRLVNGFVVDYLSIQIGGYQSAFHNFADYCQYLAIFSLFILQFKKGIFDDEYDQQIWVNKAFQKRYIFQLIKLGTALLVVLGGLTFSFIAVMTDKFALLTIQSEGIYANFLIFYLSMSAVFLMLLFFVGRRLSAHIMKPIDNFEHYLQNLSLGQYDIFLCEEPEFKYLENLSDKVRDHLNQLQEKADRHEIRSQKNKQG